jgi:hypothetical protein
VGVVGLKGGPVEHAVVHRLTLGHHWSFPTVKSLRRDLVFGDVSLLCFHQHADNPKYAITLFGQAADARAVAPKLHCLRKVSFPMSYRHQSLVPVVEEACSPSTGTAFEHSPTSAHAPGGHAPSDTQTNKRKPHNMKLKEMRTDVSVLNRSTMLSKIEEWREGHACLRG